ncbi:hypothetical protein ACQ4M3_00930 [Leptolyngbya sp. AN03gr2]|uniref:hypothetical protein n=1 Tax=unclassified Leptolyngbya TaxID=2650499 RepID=UPI003D3182FC
MKELQVKILMFWFWVRFSVNRSRKNCQNCALASASAYGDGWNEPRFYEWKCPHQERELKTLVDAYEYFAGEVEWEFATVCPLYQELTEAEQLAESLSE